MIRANRFARIALRTARATKFGVHLGAQRALYSVRGAGDRKNIFELHSEYHQNDNKNNEEAFRSKLIGDGPDDFPEEKVGQSNAKPGQARN